MKIIEFVEFMKKNSNRVMKEDQVMSLVKKTAEIKEYLSIKDKKSLVDKIVRECIYYENGTYRINGIEKYIYFTMYTIAAYTNLELGDDIEADFDALSESKLLPVLICAIQNEYDEVNIYLQMQCDFVLENNSIESVVGDFLSNVLDKVDDFSNVLAGYVEKFNADELFANKEDLGKLINFVNQNVKN